MNLTKYLFCLILSLVCNSALSAQEETRTSEEFHCQYTLPGKGWTWLDLPNMKGGIFAAENAEGIKVIVAATPCSYSSATEARFVAPYEKEVFSHPEMIKRDGTITTFKNLPSYECKAMMYGKITVVVKMFVANGFAYMVQVMGGADPVEDRPILNRSSMASISLRHH